MSTSNTRSCSADRRSLGRAVLLGAALLLPLGSAYAANDHLLWAEAVASNVQPENNEYGSNPSVITWPGINGATAYSNHTKCATFLTQVFKQAYGWNNSYLSATFGSTSPTAAKYHDLIETHPSFEQLYSVYDIQAGDILAVKYPEEEESTGHVMLAHGPATLGATKAPLVEGTYQYDLEVIDSSKSGHGPNDTRKMVDGSWDSGAGIGVMRLYADENGTITGYTWSRYSTSVYYPQSIRHLVVGRLR